MGTIHYEKSMCSAQRILLHVQKISYQVQSKELTMPSYLGTISSLHFCKCIQCVHTLMQKKIAQQKIFEHKSGNIDGG